MANTFQIASYDPVALERNKRMAEMLMKQQGNVNNGTTLGALATALQGGLAGYASSRATQQEQARNQALAELLKQKGGTATGVPEIDNQMLAAALTPKEPIKLKEGESLLAPDTYQPLAKIDKQPNLPTGYRMNPDTGTAEAIPGVDPSLLRREPLVNVMVAGEKKEQEVLGEGRATRANDIYTARDNAIAKIPRLNQMRDLAMTIDTDLLTPEKAGVAKFLNAIGMDPNRINLPDITSVEKFQSVAKAFLQEELAKQKGPQTEGDAQRQEQTLASLRNTPEANLFIVDFAKALEKQKIAQADFYEDYENENGTLKGVTKAWRNAPEAQKSVFDYITPPPVPARLAQQGITQEEWNDYYLGR